MMKGPVILRSGNTEMFTADLGLRATPERFSLIVDTALPTDNSTSNTGSSVPKAHFDADIIAKRSGFSGKISAPTQTKPFKEFIDALDAIAPTESFQEDVAPTKNEPSDSAFTGSISQ